MPNQTHPAPYNQIWILLNMARTHREANFKVSPRIRDHRKRATVPAETTTSGSSCCKCNTFIRQDRVEHKWSTPPDILSNWKKYSDLTEQFTVQSDIGINYILMAYHYDVNNIITTPLNNRTGICILSGIMKVHDKLRNQGLTPKLRIIDNEVYEDLKKCFKIHIYSSNWCHHTFIREILNKGLWEPSRTTLLPPYSLWTLASPSTYGTASYPKSPWHSTCCGNTNETLNYHSINR